MKFLVRMNKFGALAIFSLFKVLLVAGQPNEPRKSLPDKPVIDSSVVGKWPLIYSSAITRTGRFVSYSVMDTSKDRGYLTITDSAGLWHRSFAGDSRCFFSKDERLALVYQRDGTHLITLGRTTPDSLFSVGSFRWPEDGDGEWIAYREIGDSGQVVLWNLVSGERRRLGHFTDYFIDRRGEFLLASDTTGGRSVLYCLKIRENGMKQIWMGQRGDVPSGFLVDNSAKRIAYLVSHTENGKQARSLWCYQLGKESAELKIKDGDQRIDSGQQIQGWFEFSKNGEWLFFYLQEKRMPAAEPTSSNAMVDIWGYRDRKLPPEQLVEQKEEPKRYLAVLSTDNNSFYRLERDQEKAFLFPGELSNANLVLISQPELFDSVGLERDQEYHRFYSLFSLKDGSRRTLRKEASALEYFSFSPEGRWLAYYDVRKRAFFSYDLILNKERNITGRIAEQFDNDLPNDIYHHPAAGIAGWIRNDSAVLIFDNFDLWEIFPDNRRPPINVTKGYGKSKQTKLRLFEADNMWYHPNGYATGDTLYFTAYDIKNKYNGFYSQVIGRSAPPEQLTMGPYTYYRQFDQNATEYSRDPGMLPVRASRANCWIVKRESATEYPNYFLTTDFKNFRELTDLHPQENYNWLTATLISYQRQDGTIGQGVLYKPENFDPAKKYPVIIHYYQRLSHLVYEFHMPNFTGESINIPWFVSQGYLVFTPDIYYKYANISNKVSGEWAYNSVIAAATMLSRLPYVNSKKIGIQGHSFGGEETNYLITHSHLFAAAAEMAGVSDAVSAYLTLMPADNPAIESQESMWLNEKGQIRMGCTLWERPDLYLRRSAVLHVDKVTTPLLIVHNKEDGQVQWRQGVELFMALRRLNKPVWMLQYDGEGHTIEETPDRLDYTIRLTQFFDYYLKDKLPPKWMTEGVPTRFKGVYTGYELDRSGKRP